MPSISLPTLADYTSAWRARTEAPDFPALTHDVEVDVAVVGAGITGVTAAAYLHEAGLSVAVLEARRIGSGVTGRSTGHVTELVDLDYRTVRKHFGDDGARALRDSTHWAVDAVEQLAKDYGFDNRFRRVPAYYYAESESDASLIEEEWEAAYAAGVTVERPDRLPLPFPAAAILRVPDQAEIDPYAHVVGLARALRERGVSVWEHTRVQHVESGEPVRLETEAGHAVRARAVVLATHTPLGRNPLQTVVVPYRSYVVGFQLPKDTYPDGLFFDTHDPYRYTRTARFDGEKVLVVGGADHKTGEGGESDAPYRQIETYVSERYTGARPRYRWSAEVFEPNDAMPFIGASPLAEGVYVATGYSGDGLTFGTVAGRLLADLLAERDNPWDDLYSPVRFKPAAGAASFVKHNVDVGVRFVADRLVSDVRDEDELLAGEGGLIRHGTRHVAVYRDDEGRLHRLSPVCPHLKCIVRWNGADRTWDCPCHGSRFAATGEPLSGPTMHGLERGDDEA